MWVQLVEAMSKSGVSEPFVPMGRVYPAPVLSLQNGLLAVVAYPLMAAVQEQVLLEQILEEWSISRSFTKDIPCCFAGGPHTLSQKHQQDR